MTSDALSSNLTVAGIGHVSAVVLTGEFEAFYRREYEQIVRIGWSLTGRRSVAEEIAQDAFLSAHRDWERVRLLDSPGAWLRRVTINRALSVLRRGVVESRGIGRLGRERVELVELPESTAEVWRVLRRLPRRQIETLVLVVIEDRSVAEVALILECGEQTVRTHLRRGRTKMAELLGVQEAHDDLA
jgi:RNA polymerase sigma factor (sigma-70 family)